MAAPGAGAVPGALGAAMAGIDGAGAELAGAPRLRSAAASASLNQNRRSVMG